MNLWWPREERRGKGPDSGDADQRLLSFRPTSERIDYWPCLNYRTAAREQDTLSVVKRAGSDVVSTHYLAQKNIDPLENECCCALAVPPIEQPFFSPRKNSVCVNHFGVSHYNNKVSKFFYIAMEPTKKKKREKKSRLNRPVNGRREPHHHLSLDWDEFLRLLHADCYIIGYLHEGYPHESVWWWKICIGLAPRVASVSAAVGNDAPTLLPNVSSRGEKNTTWKLCLKGRRRKKERKKGQKETKNDKCSHHLHKTTVRRKKKPLCWRLHGWTPFLSFVAYYYSLWKQMGKREEAKNIIHFFFLPGEIVCTHVQQCWAGAAPFARSESLTRTLDDEMPSKYRATLHCSFTWNIASGYLRCVQREPLLLTGKSRNIYMFWPANPWPRLSIQRDVHSLVVVSERPGSGALLEHILRPDRVNWLELFWPFFIFSFLFSPHSFLSFFLPLWKLNQRCVAI